MRIFLSTLLLTAFAATASSAASPVPDLSAPPAASMTIPRDDPDALADEPAMPGWPTEVPEVLYDPAALPAPVRDMRQRIVDAAATGDPEALRPVIADNGIVPEFGPREIDDPIAYLMSQSGDAEGREILAILIEVLDAGFVHADAGTPDDMYVWPYFARYPVDKLTPRQMVELFKLIYAGDYEDMLAYSLYTAFRVGISPDGTWRYFLTE